MKGRSLSSTVRMVACSALVVVIPSVAHSDEARFRIGRFEITVLPDSPLTMHDLQVQRRPKRLLKPFQPKKIPASRLTALSTPQLVGKTFSGQGTTSVRAVRFKVTFSGVRLAVAEGRGDLRGFRDGTLVATSGTVKGAATTAIRYQYKALGIDVDAASVRITPDAARAAVVVTVPTETFAPSPSGVITLESVGCDIAPDGSLFGDDFSGDTSVLLRGTGYGFRIRPTDAQAVRLGAAFTPPNDRPGRGVTLEGVASRDTVEAFSFDGRVTPEGAATFHLNLEQQVTAYPEIGYSLLLKTGRVKLQYQTSGTLSIDGGFTTDISVPANVRDESGQAITLTDAGLDTDSTDALFGRVAVPARLRAGAPFLLEPAEKGTRAYFPLWPLTHVHSSYAVEKPDADCGNLGFLFDKAGAGGASVLYDAAQRPGLTVLQGTLYLTSPQVETDSPAHPQEVKSRFSGAVTLTHWGLVGPLEGRGFSFVPREEDIEEGATSRVPLRATWERILEAGATRPTEPQERFRLANLRILDMRLGEMRLCRNELAEGSARFTYFVHFPFPSFIHLDFEDKTLDGTGRFSHATGPLATTSLVFQSQQSAGGTLGNLPDSLPKGTELTPNPDTHILWAWRLPVSFADRGVTITHDPPPSTRSKVFVEMDETRRVSGAILNSEIWLKPLYSSNSAVRSGLRFAATLDSESGQFALTEWDRDPFFAMTYATPDSERDVGFAVNLDGPAEDGIALAAAASDPVSRHSDFGWRGGIQFPFFSGEAVASWKPLGFEVKDLVPRLSNPLSAMTAENGKHDCTSPGSAGCTLASLDSTLRVTVRGLDYSPTWSGFSSTDVDAFDIGDTNEATDLEAVLLRLSAYTSADLRTAYRGTPNPLELEGSDTFSPGECGRDRWVRQVMSDWQPSSQVRDLVCYDQAAVCVRGTCGRCSEAFLLGTYETRTRECEPPGACPEKAVVSIPNARYYHELVPPKLAVSDAAMSVTSDELDIPHLTAINVPSAQIGFSEDGRFLEGAFGATLAPVAAALPYEGELRFLLDTHCGYYYFQGAGSFTYWARFSGQTFIVNAPYGYLTQPSALFGVSDILEDLRIRALFDSVEDFTDAAGLRNLGPDTVISGVFNGGNAKKGYDLGKLHAELGIGPGSYLYQFRDSTGPSYRLGTFAKARASAEIDVLGFGVGVYGNTLLASEFFSVGSLPDLDLRLSQGELSASGRQKLTGCVGVVLGHCEGWLDFPNVTLSTSSGLDFGSFTLGGDCGSGGCN